MTDYEMLSVVLTIGILVVSIIALCVKAKKYAAPLLLFLMLLLLVIHRFVGDLEIFGE